MNPKLRLFRALTTLLLTVCLSWSLLACSSPESDAPAAPEPAADPAPVEAPSTARVFFDDLENGSEVPTLVELVFRAENYTIEPVGEGMVHEGAGHYHIGLDTECLPAGEVIPTADPWIHFGDGSDRIEMTLDPGEHTLVLQIGDGEHRTQADPGLCQVVTVTAVADEG